VWCTPVAAGAAASVRATIAKARMADIVARGYPVAP
jgi:hypothetical protein